MYQTITFSDFCDAFRAHDRNENFSYDGKRILFDWLEEMETSTDNTRGYELDIIALCCEYSEDSTADIANNYGIELHGDKYTQENIVSEYLSENTCYLGMTEGGNHVYQPF